jgi:zinc-finger of transposase IS204/IS1001/IS1096/IS1165
MNESADCKSASNLGSDSLLMKFGRESTNMQQTLRPSALVPRGFVVESAVCDGATTLITVRHTSKASACPRCGTSSERIHSRYLRRIPDLPMAGRPVRLVLVARRFHCGAVLCSRRIFTERFDGGVLARPGRGEPRGLTMSSIISGLP